MFFFFFFRDTGVVHTEVSTSSFPHCCFLLRSLNPMFQFASFFLMSWSRKAHLTGAFYAGNGWDAGGMGWLLLAINYGSFPKIPFWAPVSHTIDISRVSYNRHCKRRSFGWGLSTAVPQISHGHHCTLPDGDRRQDTGYRCVLKHKCFLNSAYESCFNFHFHSIWIYLNHMYIYIYMISFHVSLHSSHSSLHS